VLLLITDMFFWDPTLAAPFVVSLPEESSALLYAQQLFNPPLWSTSENWSILPGSQRLTTDRHTSLYRLWEPAYVAPHYFQSSRSDDWLLQLLTHNIYLIIIVPFFQVTPTEHQQLKEET